MPYSDNSRKGQVLKIKNTIHWVVTKVICTPTQEIVFFLPLKAHSHGTKATVIFPFETKGLYRILWKCWHGVMQWMPSKIVEYIVFSEFNFHFSLKFEWLSVIIFSNRKWSILKKNMRQKKSVEVNDGFPLTLSLMPCCFSVFSLWTLKVWRQSRKDSKETQSVFQQLSSFSFLFFLCLFWSFLFFFLAVR